MSVATCGHAFLTCIAGESFTDKEKDFYRRVKPSGLTLFARNLIGPAQICSLVESIYAFYAKEIGFRPIIAIDQEGGLKERLPQPFTHWPGNRALAAAYEKSGNTEYTRQCHKAIATELKLCGINTNFAPVADLDTNPNNPIIGERAFGKDPKVVAELCAAAVKGHQDANILCCAKHFPGHGDTSLDSHLDLPLVDTDVETLQNRELMPFKACINAGVDMVMSAHVIYEEVDVEYPATVCDEIMTDWLRNRLRFQGLALSDDLEMKALADHFDLQRTLAASIHAGCDLLLVCTKLDYAEEAVALLEKWQEQDRHTRKTLEATKQRLTAFRQDKLADCPIPDLSQLRSYLASGESTQLAKRIQQA